MKILILGSTGMLGHQLVKSLGAKHEIRCAPRGFENTWIVQERPAVVINCAGVVKQRITSKEEMIEVNSLKPHRWARRAAGEGARFIHFSTDCVFSGKRGYYKETSEPTPVDLYGRSKLLGEVYDTGCVTLRTSFIGRQRSTSKHVGLVEWFLSQKHGLVPGYTGALFNGLTTIAMAKVVEHVLAKPKLSGLYHVGGDPITKYGLLLRLAEHYSVPVGIVPDKTIVCNRVLDSSKFQKDFEWTPPTWPQMIEELT